MSEIVLLKDVEKVIAGSIARTLFSEAYVSNEEEHGRSPPQGRNWDNFVPKTPASGINHAYRLIGAFEQINNGVLIAIFAAACRDNNVEYTTPPREFVEAYGYYIAMESLGHGVSWNDDHNEHVFSGKEIQHPYITNPFFGDFPDESSEMSM